MKKFGKQSATYNGIDKIKINCSLLPKGKWLKLETYFKISQRTNKLLIDELRIIKIK